MSDDESSLSDFIVESDSDTDGSRSGSSKVIHIIKYVVWGVVDQACFLQILL